MKLKILTFSVDVYDRSELDELTDVQLYEYALLEEWTSCFHRVLGSSGYYDMTAKEMNIYLDGLIAGLSEAKKMYSSNVK